MNCWKILGLAPDSDAKTIKLAYSKLLKQTRPEDDPDGFTALHNAYKTALALAKRRSSASPSPRSVTEATPPNTAADSAVPDTEVLNPAPAASESNSESPPEPLVETLQAPDSNSEPADTETTVNQVVHSTPVTPDQPPAEPIIETLQAPQDPDQEAEPGDSDEQEFFQQPGYQQNLDKDSELIQNYVKELLASPRRLNKVQEWKYIESVPSMVDLHFSAQASDWIFATVSLANAEKLEKGDLLVRQPVLRYLNDFFQWESHWQRFENTYGDERSDAVFKYTTANNKTTSNMQLHYFGRIMAFGVDMIIGGMCYYIAATLPVLSFMTIVALLYFLIVIPVMEASPLQASVGKKMFQLVVVDRSGLRLRWYHSFIRSYITYACLAGFKLVVWINMYTGYKYQKLLQDLMSRSDVVERKQ